jgi:hypothetical protein
MMILTYPSIEKTT